MLLLATTAWAVEGFPFKVKVGAKGAISLPTPNLLTLCDDPSLISIGETPDGQKLELTGLKPGKTQCSFGAIPGRGFRALYDITVVP
jgi:hypothetical protein